MARKVLPLLAIAGAVAIFAASNNANAKSTNTNKKDDGLENLPIPPIPADKVDPIPEPTPLPPLPKLPDINDNEDLPPPKGDNDNQVKLTPNYNEIFWRYLLNNNEQPLNPVPTDLWISKTCNSWGIGKQFAGLLPAKYVYENAPNPDELISPTQWYLSSTTKDITPVPHYVANLEQDLPYRSWARNLIIYYSGGSCGNNIPRRKDFKSYKEFDNVLQKFITQTNTGKLYKDLYTLIGNWLLTAWKDAYPSQYADETLKYWSLWAIRNFPNLTAANQTDEAYKKAFADDKNAPKKIDPNNSNHEMYKDAWVWMNIQIKQYRDWIKKYGDFKDPLE